MDFEKFDLLHYKTENELLKLAESIQRKIKQVTVVMKTMGSNLHITPLLHHSITPVYLPS